MEKKQVSGEFMQQEYMLGTDIVVNIEGNKAEKASNAVFQRISEIQNKMTIHNNESEIAIVNENAGLKKVNISSDTYYVLNKAIQYSKLTKGSFDPTIGPLVKLWQIGTENENIPDKADIEKSLSLVDYKMLQLKNNGSPSAYLPQQGQIVDLGGIAKGYAGDEAKKILQSYGINRGIINLGGNIMAVGTKKDGSPWSIGIQDPSAPRGSYMGIVSVKDKAVVSSGPYERYFIKAGKRYHHIIDPKTGYPSESNLIGVTIISDKGIDADALSTGLYVLGLTGAMEIVENTAGIEAIFITGGSRVYCSEGIKQAFQLTSKDYYYEEY